MKLATPNRIEMARSSSRLVSSACFADFGHQVTCIEKDQKRVAALNRGEMPIFEPGLANLVEANMRQGRLAMPPRGLAVRYDGHKHTVARMPQGKDKSGCPHEPQRRRLPLGDRFGMLPPGVSVIVEAVTMR